MEAWQEKRNLAESVTYAFDHSLWTDVELVCTNENGETLQIKAHKMMLASRSPVFEAMLFGPAADKGNTIQITTFSYEQMDLLIRFLYSEAIEISDDNAGNVLKTAHFFQVPSLVEKCCQLLQNRDLAENDVEDDDDNEEEDDNGD
ncbi:uncharacterized protein LOC128221408 [Mya arenaria]|uniref:uncharacterized protein LOC128221408 n=1 Tax=Mya arenaria TaxID=6604 RepID=UPI0022E00473|nr:uncharacterized protein LOC128221408 [Mya arenaria]